MLGFYSFGFLNPETIEKLIARDDLTIEELLDEDNIVQEIKGSSEKFGNYMGHHPELIKNMLNYIIIEPDQIELDYKKCYKYPFLASEIFYAEIDGIINAFFDEKPNSSGLHEENPEEHDHNENSSSDRNPNDENSDNSTENAENIDNSEGITNPYEKQPASPEKSLKEESKEEEKYNGDIMIEKNFELMGHLFGFFTEKIEEKLNVTSVGYFAKVVNALLNKRFLETINYLISNYPILMSFITRVGYKSIGDILGRIILMDIPFLEDYNANNNMLFPDLRRKLLSELLLKFATSEDFDELHNITFILCEMLNKYDRINYGRELVEHLIQSDLSFFFTCLKDEKSIKPTSAVNFLSTLIEFYLIKTEQQNQTTKPVQHQENNEEMDKPPCVEINLELFNEKIKLLLEKFADLVLDILNLEPEVKEEIEMMHGQKIRPIKFIVIKIIELLNFMLKIEGIQNLENLVCKSNVFSTLWDLMISHEWNNLLHGKIEKIILTVLRSDNLKYKENLFEKAGIIDKIIIDMDTLEYVMPNEQHRKLKKGYTGFITNISNEIINLSSSDQYINDELKKNERWGNYEENILKNLNNNNNRLICNVDPRKPNNFELNMDNLPFYFEQRKINKDDENDDGDLNDREDQEDAKDIENKALIMEDNFPAHLNNYINQLENNNNDEDLEEIPPEDEKDISKEPFCLRDHLEIEEFAEKNEQDIKNKFEEEEISAYNSNNYWKLDLNKLNLEDLSKELEA